MSEAVAETTETNPDAEPDTEPEHIDGDDGEQEPEPEPAKPSGPSSEAVMQAADKENRRYHQKLDKILGDDPNRHECAACNGLGVAWGEQGEVPDLVHPANLVMCEFCNGWGIVETGSKSPDHVTAICTECQARGYRTIAPQATPIAPVPAYVPPTEQPVAGQFVPGRGFIPYGSTEPIPGSLTG